MSMGSNGSVLALVTFLITVSILVVFHEFGHYLFARLFKVKVLTFSLGFGPKLFTFKTKANEWCISAIPLGGYIRMLDEREGAVSDNEKHLAFNCKPAYQKIIIAFAGPFFNLLFAFLAYYFLAVIGVSSLKPVIADVNPVLLQVNQITLSSDTVIKSINAVPVTTWKDADEMFHHLARTDDIVKLNVQHNALSQEVTLSLKKLRAHYNKNLFFETLGLYPVKYLPIIAYIEPNSRSALAGLKVHDTIVAVNGINISSWFMLVNKIQDSPGILLKMSILRANKLQSINIIPDSVDNDGQVVGKIGIMPTLDQSLLEKNSFSQKYSLSGGLAYAFNACASIIVLNFTSIYDIIIGKISLSNLGGPITVAKVGSGAMTMGIKSFIDFLALISIGLAIMNLLPIPVLDGGHIVIYTLEWILGHKLSDRTLELMFKVGFMLIIGISILAIYNDILRL